jgi:uncharacterized Fe-S center protein
MTKDISSEGLIRVYKVLGRKASGKVAVKISSGEPGGHTLEYAETLGLGKRKYELISVQTVLLTFAILLR